ncbi:thiamine phosphate synthase [Paenibacillus thermoaerophilus]|nr:thiamine phosphate synthase [Paenibacillus thermoaerophilus]
MKKHALHYITTGKMSLKDTLSVASLPGVLEAVRAFHIREKARSPREVLEWAEAMAEAVGTDRLWINDRADIAAAVGAGGLHLPAAGLPPHAARAVLPRGCRIGRSVHSVQEAAQAQAEGADYLLFGHVYPTGSKPGLPARGLDLLAEIVSFSDLPVLAIGGITPERTPEVLATGCAGIAVMSTGFESPDPERTALAYRSALDECDREPKRVFPPIAPPQGS